MKKFYLLLLLVIITCFTSHNLDAQNHIAKTNAPSNIEGLSVYPNPVSSARPYIKIASKYNSIKKIEIYDVLGKKVFAIVLPGRELNLSDLKKGVYILKITENSISESRKLVIN